MDSKVAPFYDPGIKRDLKITAEASSTMKFSKPQYDAKEQMYRVTIDNGLLFTLYRENNEWKESLTSIFENSANALIQQTIHLTQGWFSKPLTPEYLQSRLQMHCPTENWDDFEGQAEYKLTALTISKQAFVFMFTLLSKTPVEKHIIDLADGEEGDSISESPPLEENDNEEPLTVGPTRRRLMKMHVMRARAKAAKALYKAEQMTQAYCDAFGEDTDWDESDEEEDSAFEEEENEN